MENAWDIKEDDTRIADTLPTFIISCEDKVCEVEYFRSLETNFIKINTIGNRKSKFANVNKTVIECITNNIFDIKENRVWCVFDRDVNEKMQNEINVEFDESIDYAESKSISVAWSNDAFELWILLHFQDVATDNDEYKNRSFYYEQLSAIFSGIESDNHHLNRIRNSNGYINYKEHLKNNKWFKEIVIPILKNKIQNAINRAKQLEKSHMPNLKPHQLCPFTKVHYLVEELLRLGSGEE